MKFMRRFVSTLALVALASPAHAAGYDLTPEGNAQFLADFAALKDVVRLPDGLMYRPIVASPKGTSPLGGQDEAVVEYRGWQIDDRVFDQTNPGEPRTFQVGGLIAGWREALMKMKTGDQWQIVVPTALAYGADSVGGIPPNQTLIFLVKLEKVNYAP